MSHLTGHYVAVLYEEPGSAIGVMFPDLPGCFSAGDTTEEVVANAAEIVPVFLEPKIEDGRPIPPPRSWLEPKSDPEFGQVVTSNQVAVIHFPVLSHPIAGE